MVVELEVVVDDGMVDVIELEEVLQRPRSLFVHDFDIVDFDGWDGNGGAGACFEDPGQAER